MLRVDKKSVRYPTELQVVRNSPWAGVLGVKVGRVEVRSDGGKDHSLGVGVRNPPTPTRGPGKRGRAPVQERRRVRARERVDAAVEKALRAWKADVTANVAEVIRRLTKEQEDRRQLRMIAEAKELAAKKRAEELAREAARPKGFTYVGPAPKPKAVAPKAKEPEKEEPKKPEGYKAKCSWCSKGCPKCKIREPSDEDDDPNCSMRGCRRRALVKERGKWVCAYHETGSGRSGERWS